MGRLRYIAYYRVSTATQRGSGLGLEAQREAVTRFARLEPPIAEYTEIKSGKSDTNRPQLLAAITHCRKEKAVLVIAGSNDAFISTLDESDVSFICCDIPKFVADDRVRVSPDFFWARGAVGTISEPPSEVVALSGPWEGLTRLERSALGEAIVYWVWFDEPQLDADGDGPYRGGQIHQWAMTLLSE